MLNLLRKSLCVLLTVTMFWMYGGGLAFAQAVSGPGAAAGNPRMQASPLPDPNDLQFDAVLDALKEKLKSEATKGPTDRGEIQVLENRIRDEDRKVRGYFQQQEKSLKEKGVPGEMMERHQAFARAYKANYAALMAQISDIKSSDQKPSGWLGKLARTFRQTLTGTTEREAAGKKALAFLEKHSPPAKNRASFDPNNLPHRTLKADKPIPPKLTPEEWQKAFPKEAGKTGAAFNLSPIASAEAATPAPTPEDLSETIEVKFTPEIRQLAESLGKNPVKIYNWVRNNIEFVPTWGSIQGAQLCLETRSCNAFDSASLLIALLRVSGIPARYQMGTIEVSIDKFMNWAGGFTNAEAAASFFASAGVPSVVRRVDQGGQVASVKLEHVWVETFVDFVPSGGAIQLRGDTWIQLDPSFKQYSFGVGADLSSIMQDNFQSFAFQLTKSASIEPLAVSITGIDSALGNSYAQQKFDQLASYLKTNLANETIRGIIGEQTIIKHLLPTLPATLPYHIITRATEQSKLPDNLRHKLTISLESVDQSTNTAVLFNYSENLPALAGKNILLLYKPASPTDEEFLLERQNSWSALIKLIPQLYVGNVLVAEGSPMYAGSPVVSKIEFTSPTISTPVSFSNMTVGESTAIGIDMEGISSTQFKKFIDSKNEIGMAFQKGQLNGLSNVKFAEALFSSVIMSWFGYVDLNNKIMSAQTSTMTVRYPSAGFFFIKQRVATLFGTPLYFSPDSLAMDIKRDIVVSASKSGNAEIVKNLSLMQGVYGSTMEAEIPVQMFSTENDHATGVATMQALKLANDQDIPIYSITSSNAAKILPLLQIESSDLSDIQDEINAGMEVMVSKKPILFNGKNILGTIVTDPNTGSSTFFITSGTHGSIANYAGVTEFFIGLCLLGTALVAGAPLFLLALSGVFLIASATTLLFTLADSFNLLTKNPFELTPVELAIISIGVILAGLTGAGVVPFFGEILGSSILAQIVRTLLGEIFLLGGKFFV